MRLFFAPLAEQDLESIADYNKYLVRIGFPRTAQVDSVTQAQRLLREDIIDKVLKRALVRMFDQACKAVGVLPEERRSELWVRLDAVRHPGHNLGYGVGDDMDDLLAEHGFDGGPR